MPVTFKAFEELVISHGLPMVITIAVLWLLFWYFLKRINSSNTSNSAELGEIKIKLSNIEERIIKLQGFLSGVLFRNRGIDDE